MLKTFDCPKCGAPVSYERNEMAGAAQPKIKCNYCGSTLVGPDEAHGQPARVVIDLRSITRSKSSRLFWVLIAIPVAIAVIVVLAMVGVLAPVFYSINRAVGKDPSSPPGISRPIRGNEKP